MAKKLIIVFTICHFLALEAAIAKDDATFSSAPAKSAISQLCDFILTSRPIEILIPTSLGTKMVRGRPYRVSSFYVNSTPGTRIGRMGVYSVSTLRPEDGIGRVIVIEIKKFWTKEHMELWSAVLAFPKYFERFEIYANENILVMPDSERLNALNREGVQLLDVPVYLKQFYKNQYFDKVFAQGKIPMGSRDNLSNSMEDAFSHDRMEEHLLGAIIMPSWVSAKYWNYSRFYLTWKNSFKQSLDGGTVYYLSSEFPGANWDRITSAFGNLFNFLNARSPYLGIVETIKVLENENQRLSTTPALYIVERLERIKGKWNRNEITNLQKSLSETAKGFPSTPLTHEQIVSEAIALVHQITNVPFEELRQIYIEGTKK